MPETMQQVVAGVYTLLRRPSQQKLAARDVQERVHDLLKGYVQDMNLEGRSSRLSVSEIQLDAAGDGSYSFGLGQAEEFEPVALERGDLVGTTLEYRETQLVPFDVFETHYAGRYDAAALYFDADNRARVRLNMSPEAVAASRWRLAYRLPLLAVVQMGERPPLPSSFLPMLKYDAAVECGFLVSDPSEEWAKWWAGASRLYMARAADYRERWHTYLSRSLEPEIVPLRPFNSYRSGNRFRNPRAYLEVE